MRKISIILIALFTCMSFGKNKINYNPAKHVTFLDNHLNKARETSKKFRDKKIDQKTAILSYSKSLASCRKLQKSITRTIKDKKNLQSTRFLKLIQAHNLLEGLLVARILEFDHNIDSSFPATSIERMLLKTIPSFRKKHKT